MYNIKKHLEPVPDRELNEFLNLQEHVMDDCIENAQRRASDEEIDDLSRCEGLYFAFELYRAFAQELRDRNRQKSSTNLKKAQ